MGKVTRMPVTIDAKTGKLSDVPTSITTQPVKSPLQALLGDGAPVLIGIGLVAGYLAGKNDVLENLFSSDEGEDDDG